MTNKRLHIVVLLLAFFFCQISAAQEESVTASASEETAPKAELNPQLKLTQDALINKGSSDEMRMNAVSVLLSSTEPQAKQILLEALGQNQNLAAQIAFCKVLIQTRTNQSPPENKELYIESLLQILSVDDITAARLAAEAMLIFSYDQVAKPLDKLIQDDSNLLNTRLNAIRALELHPDMRVAIKLLELVDNSESQISEEAKRALNLLGIPIGKDVESRSEIISKLENEGQEAYLREQLIRQKSEISKTKIESNLWLVRYLAAQDQLCDAIADDVVKGKFLAQHLGAAEATTKLWALEKLRQLRLAGKTTPKLTAEVGDALVLLISDKDSVIRLKTSDLLSLMGQVNSAQRLLAQLEVEINDQVRTALFSALEGACYYAFLDTSPFKIPPETRKQTLEWAAKYVSDDDSLKAQKGAAAMGRLLEQDGLTPEEADRYLGLLAEKYKQQKDKPDGTLRGEIVGAMAGLCVQGVHSAQSKTMFGPLFEDALTDKADRVRERAVDGLRNVDKVSALARLRKGFVEDPSPRVRSKIISLAAEVGGKEDLAWLYKKIGSNGESEPAWQAMLKIFAGSDVVVLAEWIDRFTAPDSKVGISNEQKVAFLETAERRILGLNNPAVLEKVRSCLFQLYSEMGQYEKAAAYVSRLRESAESQEKRQTYTQNLLDIYIKWQKPDLVAKVVGEALQEADLDPNGILVKRLDEHLSQPPAGIDPNGVYGALANIKVASERPKWQQWLKAWTLRLGGGAKANKPKETTEPEKG